MSEKEFLKVFVNRLLQLGFMFKNYSEEGLENILEDFLKNHHEEYYTVRFENKKEYSEKAKDNFTI